VLAPIDQIDKHPYTRPRAWSFRQFDRKSAIVPTEILPLRWSHAGRKKNDGRKRDKRIESDAS
jgi:hypothetical protein